MKLTRQFDQMDCGPACVRMVAGHYGKDYPLSYLRTHAQLNREGVSVAGIREALEHIGMDSSTFEMTNEQLATICPIPAILHWEQNHFVVLYKIKQKRNGNRKYYVANPAYGKHTYSEEEFNRYWLNGDKGVVIGLEPTVEFYHKQPVKQKHSFFRFWQKYVWPFRTEMSQLALGLLCGILLSLITPFLTQAMVDNGIGMRDMGIITSIMVAQLCIFVGSFTMNIISSWVALYMSTRININVLNDYLSKLLRLPMTFFETKSVGDYQQRIGDHARLQGFTTSSTMNTAFSLVSCAVLSVVIGFYNIYLLLGYLSFTALSLMWMTYFFHKRKALDYEVFKIGARNQNKLFELMNGITDIKLNVYENYKIKEWNQMQEQLYEMSQRTLKLNQIQGTGYTVIGQLRNILLTFWIATQVVNGDLTLGMMMSISAIIGQIDGPLSQLLGFVQQFQDAKISLERSEEVHLCQNEDTDNLLQLPDTHPLDIHIRNLTFRYAGSVGKPALDNVSLTIPAGKTTAIVGESGSGKTTLMKLLLKFYDLPPNSILIGNHCITTYSASSIRQSTGIVMQDNFVFSDTIKQNIVLGEEADEVRLSQAIHAACLDNYVADLPLGVHTKIGSEGNGISGGERQRIMIARAVYKQPVYMMLDEATSSLDAENERKITHNLAQTFDGRTMLVIAHRLSTVKNADNIIVLKRGKVVEQGTHDSLIAQQGEYYNLIKNQLELSKE